MLADFVPLVTALAVAACVYAWRERRRRQTEVRPPFPDIAILDAWRMWRAAPASHPDLPLVSPPAPEAPEARDVEAGLADGGLPDSRVALRRAILERATTGLLLEIVAGLPEPERALLLKGYQPGMDGRLRSAARAAALEWLALRWYAKLHYDDAVPDDWFQHFFRLAQPYLREKVRLAREFLLETDPGAGRFAAVYDALLAELREQALRARPKRRFVPPGV